MAQILAVVIFAVMFLLIVTEKIERHWVSLGCGLLMLVVVFGFCMHSPAAVWNTLGLQSFASVDLWYQASEGAETASGINWSTILFIAGMMLMVEGMGRAGFFRWLCLQLARLVKYKTIPLFLAFMVMSSVLSMFIDSITVILFLAAATVELSRILRFNPVPMIIAEIFCANLGGAATMCGDPPNIIIGTSLGYSFADFVANTGLIVAVGLVLVIVYFFLCFRKELQSGPAQGGAISYPNPKDAIENKMCIRDMVEIQRNILAARFSCAPSQINYVLTTRFTPVQGFRVESRRGGGGFVRVIRIDRTRVEYMEELRTAIGQALTYAAAAQLLDALCRSGTLAPQQARLMLAAVSEEIIGKDQAASQLRARIVGSMLRCAAKEGRTHAL